MDHPGVRVTSGRVTGGDRSRVFPGACGAVAYIQAAFAADTRPWDGEDLYYPPRAYTNPERGYGRLIYRHPEDRNRG